MAPKKKGEKMSLGDFLGEGPTSWAEEMEDVPISDSRPSGYGSRTGYSSNANTYSTSTMGGYSVREELPLPSKPPYTVHLGNLSFDATSGDVQDFFAECECTNVRIIEDKMEMKPKGFGYAEFATLDGLKQALTLNGASFQGRNIRISVADPPKDREGPSRDFGDWSRKGPLPELPGRGGDRGGDRRPTEYNSDRRERRDGPPENDRFRDLGNWERKGPLSPLAQAERSMGSGSRDGGRPRSNDESMRDLGDRRVSPAAWGEGRAQGSQDGSRPPRRDFQERPQVERAPTAADQDNQWRAKMRPDAPTPTVAAGMSPALSREGSEAPDSPALSTAPMGRPKLNLAKRTVSEAPESSPASTTSDAKASPFGAARPIDTAAKEKEIEEKRLLAVQEKKEAEDKAKAEREAVKAAAKAAEQTKKESAEAEANVETPQQSEEPAPAESTIEKENAEGQIVDDKSVKPKEIVQEAAPKAAEGAWRRPSGGPPRESHQRDDAPRGSRGRGDGPRGRGDGPRGRGDYGARGRGDHIPRGPRHHDGNRTPKQDMNGSSSPRSPITPVDPETQALEADGWSTVSKSKKNSRGGGGQAARAIAS